MHVQVMKVCTCLCMDPCVHRHLAIHHKYTYAQAQLHMNEAETCWGGSVKCIPVACSNDCSRKLTCWQLHAKLGPTLQP